MIHVMLDLETWGTRPGADIRSIGAVIFDPAKNIITGDTFYVACDNPPSAYKDGSDRDDHKYPLHRDPRTLQWWSEQSDEAQAAFADPVELREALVRFADWYYSLACAEPMQVRLWSHGVSFDPPILAAAYEAVGLPVPWHYRAPRDTRTAFDLAGIDDHSAWLKQHPGPLGVPHHALDDAICQARAVCAAQRLVQRWRNTSNSSDALPSYLNNIVRDIEDEGDRAYFGSTNDADHLRQIAEDLDAGRFERDCEDDEQ